jgi:hypothetical protein
MTEIPVEDAVDIRDKMEDTAGVLQAVIVKLNEYIDGEISSDEYIEWTEEHEEMFDRIRI